MQKLDPKTDGRSVDIVAENIEKLKTLFPEVFTEGGIDFDALKETLGEYIDEREERYSFTWNGKSKARLLSQTPSTGTLRPCPEESVNWDTTQNLFIEGDNLEVLKLLQKSYYKKVKMIYIDPPYNTGKDFIYPDDFRDNIQNYLELTGQVDSEGRKISTNSETSGRYHTDWLNMMYPRLKLARNLLQDNGVIFISIDDKEIANLIKICNEIFGEENSLGTTVRVGNSTKNNANQISITHEYCLVYARDKDLISKDWQVPKNNVREFVSYAKRLRKEGLSVDEIEAELKILTKYPRFYDFDHYYYCDDKGVYRTDNPGGVKSGNMESEILHPITNKPCKKPDGGWRYKEEKIREMLLTNFWHFGKDENTVPTPKRYLDDYLSQKPTGVSFFDSQTDTKSLKAESIPFDYPKPVEYIKYLLRMDGTQDEIVLDFFAGSGTTAHAIFELNLEEGRKLKFIMVQLPETTYEIIGGKEVPKKESVEAFKAGYKTIAEIGKERIRRVIKKVKEEAPDYKGDLGFKVFKLDSTNIKPWEMNPDNLQSSLDDYISNIKDGRSEHDILYEILLKYGLELTLPIEERTIAGKTVFVIGYGALVICLADDITLETVEGIAGLKKELQPEIMRVVFKDTGFKNDVVKTNAVQILKLAGIEDVKSL